MKRGRKKFFNDFSQEDLIAYQEGVLCDYEKAIEENNAWIRDWNEQYKSADKNSTKRWLMCTAEEQRKKFIKIRKGLMKNLDSVMHELVERRHSLLTNLKKNKLEEEEEDFVKEAKEVADWIYNSLTEKENE